MTTQSETFTLFPEDHTPPPAISQAERDYRRGFEQRKESILQRRKMAQIANERDMRINAGDIRTVYKGVYVSRVGEAWKAVHVETVIWTRVWDDNSLASNAA